MCVLADQVQVVEITPPALDNIGYKTYIIFAVFNVVAAVLVWCFYPETTGLPLEEIDLLFLADDQDVSRDAKTDDRFYHRFQWRVVPKAWRAVKENRAAQATGRVAGVAGVTDVTDAELGDKALFDRLNEKGVDHMENVS